ncbi:MAG: histidine kinase [Sulfuritalea sp.]|nr:histidine kinase [Sulfuritalea sp.]MDP1985025.1 histidine kinase [Sulfuritalea sp.]
MSLRLRLNLLVAGLNLGFLVALTWLMVDNHRNSIQEEIEAAHRVAVQMLGTAAQTSRFFGSAPTVMADYLQSLGRVRANEIRLYSEDGVLRYDSPPSAYKAGRRAPDWFELRMRPKIKATVIGLPGARIEIVPDASRAVLDAWDSMRAIVLLGLGFVALLHGALLLFLRRLLRPTEADARRLVATTRQLAENREVTRLIQAGVEEERKRLARELHDELGQSVTAIRLIAASIARSSESDGAAQGSAKINEIAAGLYDSVHRIVRELRPAVLEQPDLAAALADLGREWRLRHPEIELALTLEGDLGDLGEAATLAVFRCVQEALTNVLKHAQASRVDLRVARRDGRLDASIEDNGRGASGVAGAGHGLVGMRERVVALGGSLEAAAGAAGGFRVSMRLPLPGDSE